MAILHTVSRSPTSSNDLQACLWRAQVDSAVLLLEDGVYGALNSVSIDTAATECKWYAIEPDCIARGLDLDSLRAGVELVDYAGFVKLVEEYDVVQAWR